MYRFIISHNENCAKRPIRCLSEEIFVRICNNALVKRYDFLDSVFDILCYFSMISSMIKRNITKF